jgi:hypothetical protein
MCGAVLKAYGYPVRFFSAATALVRALDKKSHNVNKLCFGGGSRALLMRLELLLTPPLPPHPTPSFA